MNNFKALLASAASWLRVHSAPGINLDWYETLHLDECDIAEAKYKQYLGGGVNGWQARGLFQLQLMMSCGLDAKASILDVGCGPIRGGVHFIRQLEAGKYCGIDSNESFITAAQHVITSEGLCDKKPILQVVKNFEIQALTRRFDFILAFSVLNHCNTGLRRRFFSQIGSCMHNRSKLVISHGAWLRRSHLQSGNLEVAQECEPNHFALKQFGWSERDVALLFPVYVVKLKAFPQ